jgi:protein gp37/ParB-like chromosome segregation protein Spo0J
MNMMPTDQLKTGSPFVDLFPVAEEMLIEITESMRVDGYDRSQPIRLWRDVVIDGHTRLQAAIDAELSEVAVFEHHFPDEDAALRWAIKTNRARRNFLAPELVSCIEAVDRRKQSGERTDLAPGGARSAKSAEETAKIVGTSTRTVERVRLIVVVPEVKELVLRGELSIEAGAKLAAKKIKEQGQYAIKEMPVALISTPIEDALGLASIYGRFSVAEWNALDAKTKDLILEEAPNLGKGQFTRTNESVDWAWWTWNPVTGCLHGCPYCYAEEISHRIYPQLFVPTFIPAQLGSPRRNREPNPGEPDLRARNVFTCSMADLFGKWVPADWIDAVFHEIVNAPQWRFLCLTKFPQRLAELEWPTNTWAGTTVDIQKRVKNAEQSFRGVTAGVKWLSCEPMLERLTFSSLDMFDWVVIGGQSPANGEPEFQPPWEWIEHLYRQAREAGCRVYFKENLKNRPKEMPDILDDPYVVVEPSRQVALA